MTGGISRDRIGIGMGDRGAGRGCRGVRCQVNFRVGTLTRSECIIVIIYGWYHSFILISW